jgi:hypothetical protein
VQVFRHCTQALTTTSNSALHPPHQTTSQASPSSTSIHHANFARTQGPDTTSFLDAPTSTQTSYHLLSSNRSQQFNLTNYLLKPNITQLNNTNIIQQNHGLLRSASVGGRLHQHALLTRTSPFPGRVQRPRSLHSRDPLHPSQPTVSHPPSSHQVSQVCELIIPYSSTTIAAPVVDHQTNDSVHGTNQHIYGRNQHMYGSNQPIPSINMDSVPLQTNQTVQPSNIASASIQANNTITSYRKSCETCRVRKIKCFPVAGTGPRTCEFCQEKGHKCEFKEKKPYVRTKP